MQFLLFEFSHYLKKKKDFCTKFLEFQLKRKRCKISPKTQKISENMNPICTKPKEFWMKSKKKKNGTISVCYRISPEIYEKP